MKPKAFVSHSEADASLVAELAERLAPEGIEVWNPYEELAPGDNWPRRIGQALDECDVMIVLVTPDAFVSDNLRREVEFGLTSKRYRDRLLTIIVGPTTESPRDIPWILLRQPFVQVESVAEEFPEILDALRRLPVNSAHQR